MLVYKCQHWTFNPDSQQLIYNDGTTEQLPSRLSNCLFTLISSAGQTVSYDELLLKVWGTTHKDASTISSVVSDVRKLIGCGQAGKKLIVTVPKRGYRFDDVVEIIETDTQVSSVSQVSPQEHQKPVTPPLPHKSTLERQAAAFTKKPHFKWLGFIVVLVTLLAWGVLTLTDRETAATTAVFTEYEVLSHEPGREDEFDVSRDGLWLTYVNKAPGVVPSLIVKELTTGNVQKIIASDDYYFGSPVFSNDTKQIVFHKQTKQRCEVWLADFKDFTLKVENTKKLTNCGKGGFWSTTAFSHDNNHIYFSRANGLTDPYKVNRLDLRTGFERSITSPTSTGRGDYAFALSPNGEQLAVIRNVLWQESHILLSHTADNQSHLLFKLPYLIDRITWLNQNQLAYCDKNEAIWLYDIEQKQHSKLAQIDFSCGYPQMANGELFAIKKATIKNAIWTLNKDKNDQFVSQPKITSPYYDFNSMFGPNDSLYFISNRSGKEQLWQQTEQGFRQHKDVKLPPHTRELEFSAETNSFYGITQKRLFRYDLTLGEVEWLSKKEHEVSNLSITDTGQLLFSEGNQEYWSLKSLNLYTLKITDLNMNAFAARQTGGHLYFTKFHEKGLWKKDLKSGAIEQLIKGIDIKFLTFWDIWNDEILIWAADNKFNMYDLNTGQLVNEQLTYEGHVGYLKCNRKRAMCTFSFRENDETEVVKFTN